MPGEPTAEERYAKAFEAAHRDAGFPITALTPSERRQLGPIAATHARYRDDTAITGDDLVQWIYRRTRAFRVDVTDPSRHRGGCSPFGFRAWLDNGADGEQRPLAPGQDEPEDPPEEIPEGLHTMKGPEPTAEEIARELTALQRFIRRPEAAHG